MKTILVTGGAGFIGSCFVRQVVAQQSVQVVNYDLLTYAGNLDSLAAELPDPRHTFIQADVADSQAISAALQTHEPDAIVHFAAESHVDRSIDGPAAFVQTNVVGTCTLLEAALVYWKRLCGERKDAFRLLHISTDEVYGSLGPEGQFTETTPFAPNSPYAASKAAADQFVRAYYKTYGLPVLTTNCSNNYGPYQFPEKLIPLMILNALEGKSLPVYGDGQNVRDWIYVEDHCRGLERVLQRGTPGEVYHLGGNAERSNLDVIGAICELVDSLRPGLAHSPCSSLLTYVTDRPGHDRRYAIDASKAKTELDWTPETDFSTGLRKTVEWYLSNSTWIDRVTSGNYQRERLGNTTTGVER